MSTRMGNTSVDGWTRDRQTGPWRNARQQVYACPLERGEVGSLIAGESHHVLGYSVARQSRITSSPVINISRHLNRPHPRLLPSLVHPTLRVVGLVVPSERRQHIPLIRYHILPMTAFLQHLLDHVPADDDAHLEIGRIRQGIGRLLAILQFLRFPPRRLAEVRRADVHVEWPRVVSLVKNKDLFALQGVVGFNNGA